MTTAEPARLRPRLLLARLVIGTLMALAFTATATGCTGRRSFPRSLRARRWLWLSIPGSAYGLQPLDGPVRVLPPGTMHA